MDTPAPRKKTGRPSSYTQAIADEICERIASGEPLIRICEDEHMPPQKTVFAWIGENEEFRKKYAHARALQGETYFDRAYLEAMQAGDAQIGRLRVDTLKWMASKLAPKKYGEKLEVEQSGAVDIRVRIGGTD